MKVMKLNLLSEMTRDSQWCTFRKISQRQLHMTDSNSCVNYVNWYWHRIIPGKRCHF